MVIETKGTISVSVTASEAELCHALLCSLDANGKMPKDVRPGRPTMTPLPDGMYRIDVEYTAGNAPASRLGKLVLPEAAAKMREEG